MPQIYEGARTTAQQWIYISHEKMKYMILYIIYIQVLGSGTPKEATTTTTILTPRQSTQLLQPHDIKKKEQQETTTKSYNRINEHGSCSVTL